MARGRWELRATDLKGNVIGDVLDASERKFDFTLNKIPSLTFKLPLHSRRREALMSRNTLIKGYRNGVLKFLGPITGLQAVANKDEQSIVVTAAGGAYRLQRRLVGKTAAGLYLSGGAAKAWTWISGSFAISAPAHGFTAGDRISFYDVAGANGLTPNQIYYVAAGATTDLFNVENTPGGGVVNPGTSGSGKAVQEFDRGKIAELIINWLNTQDQVGANTGYTGISVGDIYENSGTGTAGPVRFKQALELINEMASTYSGFNWEVEPVEPNYSHPYSSGAWGDGWPQIGLFNVNQSGANYIGTDRPNAIFEFGTTKANVTSFDNPIDLLGRMNRGWILAPGFPEAATDVASEIGYADQDSCDETGIFEDVVPDNGLTSYTLRDQLLRKHIEVRKDGRQQVTFVPAVDMPPHPFDDYGVGDFVRAILYVAGEQWFDAQFRVWGIAIDLDDSGSETASIKLIEE